MISHFISVFTYLYFSITLVFLCISHHSVCVLFITGPGWTTELVRLFVHGNEAEKSSLEAGGSAAKANAEKKERSAFDTFVSLVICAVGLLGCYLMWGYMQEQIMTGEYGKTEDSEGEKFKNSTFLVFMNRILALVVALIYVYLTMPSQPKHTAPLYKYSYSSFSNIMSSWFQYEALKFVSFPTQVLAKSCKVIAVMLMGRVMSKKTYQTYEIMTAIMITVGVAVFSMFSKDSMKDSSSVTTISGLLLLASYLTFDAFTSNWQGELFKMHKMSSVQMMAGVNLFSVLFTTVALLEQGGFFESMSFMTRHPDFMVHVFILSLCSAGGQLFIFHTINKFGAVVFTIIMTLRQAIAIIISCIKFHHPMSVPSLIGILIVFAAIGIRMYCAQQAKKKAAAQAALGGGGSQAART